VIEVGPEAVFDDGLVEVDAGGGDEPEVDALSALGADAAELMILEDREQLGLETEWQLGDFIEKEGAAIGLLY